MATTKRRIHSKGPFRYEEGLLTAVAAYPGYLVELTDADLSNGLGTFQAHSTEGGNAEAAFLQEDSLQGEVVTHVYDASSLAGILFPGKGAVVNVMIQVDQDIAIGEELMSAGDGTLISIADSASGIDSPVLIAIAEEACDLTGSGAENTLCAVRIV